MMAVNFSQWAAHTEKKRIKSIFSITVRKNTIQKPLQPTLRPFLLWDISRPLKQHIPMLRVFLISWFFRLIFPLRAGAFFREKTHIAFPLHKEYDSIVKEPEKIPKTIEKRRLFIVREKILKKNPLFFPPSGFPLRIFFLSPVETAKAPQETAWEPPRRQSWKTSLFIVKQLTFLRLKPHR